MNEQTFDLAWVAGVIGFFLPLVISAAKRAQWSTTAKRWTAFVLSAAAGVVNVGVQQGWQFDDSFVQSALLSVVDVYVAASVIYANFWDGTTVDATLESVGSKPDPGVDAGPHPA